MVKFVSPHVQLVLCPFSEVRFMQDQFSIFSDFLLFSVISNYYAEND